ncbi:MAG: LTA synthase family protein [Oscillospiraceae bacterium]|nr:LTA synthase family protein [Oscillospiraceae bacterium]
MEDNTQDSGKLESIPPVSRGPFITFVRNIWRILGYYIFFIMVFAMYELLLRLSAGGRFDFLGFLFSVFCNTILVTLFCYAMSFISKKKRVISSNIALSIAMAFYISQIIYFGVFGTFYNPESLSNAGQIVQFWEVILKTAWARIIYLLLCVAPIPAYNLFVRKTTVVSMNKKLKKLSRMEIYLLKRRRLIKLAVAGVAYIALLVAFIPLAKDPDAAYSVYLGQQSYEDSINRLGLLSTMQVDMIKLFVKDDMSGPLGGVGVPLDSVPDWNAPDTFTEGPGNLADSIPRSHGSSISGPGLEFSMPLPSPSPTPPAPVEYGYNVMDIDFVDLVANEKNSAVVNMHEYFAYIKPTRQNEYTGIFKGYNLIMMTGEGFSSFAVDPDLTPTIYKLVNEGFHFTDFYTSEWGVSTTDGEYVACLGLLPKSGVWSFYRSRDNYLPFAMGNQLRKLGYQTNAYHDHTYTYYHRDYSHPNMGYDYKGVGNGLVLPENVWPNSDLEMMEATMDEYIGNEPFHAYYMTVSGHLEYNFIGNAMAMRNKGAVADLPYSDPCKAYIACNIELDKALAYMLERLREAGIADKTVIVLSADHHPYGLLKDNFDGISEFLGHKVEENFEMYKNNLIIYVDGMTPITVDKPASSLDILPTISNLMGLEYDSRLLMGRDILSDSPPLVIFKDRSYITDMGRYTKEDGFVPNPGVEVDENYSQLIANEVDAKFTASARILDLDYYRKVFE